MGYITCSCKTEELESLHSTCTNLSDICLPQSEGGVNLMKRLLALNCVYIKYLDKIIITINNTAPSGHMRWELRLIDVEAMR